MKQQDSSGVVFRLLEAGDLAGFAGIMQWSVDEGWANFETRRVDVEELRGVWESRRGEFAYFVADVGGEVAGVAWASPWKAKPGYAWTAEVSVYVKPGFHGRGLAKRLYERLFEMLKKQGYRTIIAGVALPNEVSVRLHESFGMVKAAHFERNGFKMGAWRDVGYWLKHFDGEDPPGEVRGVDEVVDGV